MSRRQTNPLRALSAEERTALTQLSRSQRMPAVQVARAVALLAVADGPSYTAAARKAGRRDNDTVAEWVARGCVARIRGAGALTPAPSRLGDADIVRASEFQHAVEDIDRHVHLSRPTLIGVRAQPVPDHALEPADGGLGPGARIVARGLLPAHPALLGDELQVAVPLRRR